MASSRIHLAIALLAISLCLASAASQLAIETNNVTSDVPQVEVIKLRFYEIEVIMVVVGFIMASVLAKIREWTPSLLCDCEDMCDRAGVAQPFVTEPSY